MSKVIITVKGITIECTQEQAIAIINATEGQQKGHKDNAPKELVDFVKKDGTVVQCTPAQKAAWEAFAERKANSKSVEELKNIKFEGKFTAEMTAWIIAHPICTCKEFKTQFESAYGCTKEQLKAHKATLRAAGQMK